MRPQNTSGNAMATDAGDVTVSPPLRVLFMSHASLLAGAERCLVEILENLDRTTIEPIVLLPKRGPLEGELRRLSVPYHRVHYEWWLAERNQLPFFLWRFARSLINLPRLIVKISQLNPDVIYTNSIVIPEGAVVAACLRKKHIWHIREIIGLNQELRGPLPRWFIWYFVPRLSDQVICVSESVRRQFPADVRGVLITGFNGVATTRRVPTGVKEIDPDRVTLAVIGTVSENKGQLDAARAIDMLRHEFPTIILNIVGSGKQSHMQSLEAFIERRNLTANVRLLGYLDNAKEIIEQSDIVLVPSRMEAFGRVTLEALTAGTPVIGTSVGGTEEILRTGGGITVPPRSPELLAAAIRQVITDPDLYRTLANGTTGSAARFDLRHEVAELQAVICRIGREAENAN